MIHERNTRKYNITTVLHTTSSIIITVESCRLETPNRQKKCFELYACTNFSWTWLLPEFISK